ncbi:MAG: flagellar hook protein FlgE [Spirochaetes bacterium]|nr:flagellar hook protein FlgE [Spirochaetota bacterium]
MMRSLFSGVSGLQNHQTRMDVIGNNISNINTTGFKRSRVNFQDILYQQMRGAAAPTEQLGGVNPQDVGLGMSIASIDTIHTQGSLQTTGVPTDLAISGTGFFVLDNGGTQLFTRDGTFSVDRDGIMVSGSGMRVQGWTAQEVDGINLIDIAAPVGEILIPVGDKDPARATTMVNFSSNLDRRIPELPEDPTAQQIIMSTWATTLDIYDSFGDRQTLQVSFTRVPGVPNSWTATVEVNPQAEVATNTAVGLTDDGVAAGGTNTFTLNFSNNGTLLSAIDDDGVESGVDGPVIMNVAFDVENATPDEDGALVRQEFALNLGTVGSFTGSITQFAEASSARMVEQDGRAMGYLDNFNIDRAGVITGVFSNGSTRALGQVALASFTNQGGLERAGDNTFLMSNNSGLANIGPAFTAGKGSIIAGALEMSNVDMADQFVDMIVTQRGFQANSRTIQTADQLLQELLQLR